VLPEKTSTLNTGEKMKDIMISLGKSTKVKRLKVLVYLLKRCTFDDLPVTACRWADPLIDYVENELNKIK